MGIKRREFVKLAGLGAAASLAPYGKNLLAKNIFTRSENSKAANAFKIKFTPRVGMPIFRASAGKDPFERMKYFKSKGFSAVEGLIFINHKKPYSPEKIAQQKAMGELAKSLGLEMGCQSSMNEKDIPTMTANQTLEGKRGIVEIRDMLRRQLDTSFAVLERFNCKTFIIGPGAADKELSWQKQYDNSVENMKFCAQICKDAGFIMEIEPLNTTSHRGVFCDRASLGAKMCDDVNMSSCRLLYDVFHEQMQMGNLDTLDDPKIWKHIESFHIADVPDRKEPGTGILDFPKILKKIHDKGFRGFIGMEHLQSQESVKRDDEILEIYRKLDASI